MQLTTSDCIRCGKQRIDSKTWQEYSGKILVTITDTVCPDNSCQKIVDQELAAKREKRENFKKSGLIKTKKQPITA